MIFSGTYPELIKNSSTETSLYLSGKKEIVRQNPKKISTKKFLSIYGAQNGYQFFHLGGGLGSSEDSLYRFKKALNKNGDKQFCISKDCFDKEQYNHLVNLRKAKDPTFNENGTFFPLYRG